MAFLKILKNGDKYTATFKEHSFSIRGADQLFETSEQLERKELINYLLSKEFYQRDIYDAFDMASGTSANIWHSLFKGNEDSK